MCCPIPRIKKKKSSYKSRALILCPPTFGLRSLMWSSICQALHPPVPLTSLYWASVQLRDCAPLPDTSLSAPIKCRCRRRALGGTLVTLHVATEAMQAVLDPQWMWILVERLVILSVQERAGLFEELPQGHFSLVPLFPSRLSWDTSHLLPGSRRHEAPQQHVPQHSGFRLLFPPSFWCHPALGPQGAGTFGCPSLHCLCKW